MTEPRETAPWQAGTVESLARELYGIEARARRLPSEYDQVFQLIAQDGAAFILKVMHPQRDASFIDLQCRTLQHLAQSTPSLGLSRVIVTADGEAYKKVRGDEGDERLVWLLSYVPGKVLFDTRPHSPELLESIGELLGSVDKALQEFSHPAARRELKWDLSSPLWIRDQLQVIGDPARRAMLARAIDLYASDVAPHVPGLRKGVIYGDANDYNVLVQWDADAARPCVGLIDFGDMHEGLLVAEPAVAAAYALLGKDDPLSAAAWIVAGYHRVMPLEVRELQVLFPLIVMRLAVSVVNSALRQQARPDDPYVTISEAPAWAALEQLDTIHPRFAYYRFRQACGIEPVPGAGALAAWLTNHRDAFAPVIEADFAQRPPRVLDLGIGSALLGAEPQHSLAPDRERIIAAELRRTGADVGIGRHDEERYVVDAQQSIGKEPAASGLETVHIGMDVFTGMATAVHAPFDAIVHCIVGGDDAPAGGAHVVLHHQPNATTDFFTLYGQLAPESVSALAEGQHIAAGGVIGKVLPGATNGSQLAHLHFQVVADLLDWAADFPSMVPVAERVVWKTLSPDPNLILGIPEDRFPQDWSFADTLTQRHALLGGSLSVSYREPLKIVRGWRQHLYDSNGRAYLDVFNNVPLVGHSHPRIVDAVSRQLGLLNTNTRYLHDTVLHYAQRLVELLPAPLRVCYFVNSGSEANELAIRMARVHTHAKDMLVLENAYHGNTATVTDISPYKFNGPGGSGRKPWVHVAPIADDYRGPYRRGEPDLGVRYAHDVVDVLDRMQAEGRRLAAYIAESMPSVGGQIIFPEGYLAEVYRHVRSSGGVCIADEVQVGFGRLGSHYWGFQTQDVVPDIVVLAKPIGNCFPLAAVVTTPEIAASFNNGMEFFSTYGGNPVACAAGLAVLDVLRDEQLPANALRVGNHLLGRLRDLQSQHPLIGDVRGMGLFLGVDLVTDRETRQPATAQANYIVNRLRERGVLAGTDGPYHNVIKLRPPLILSADDAEVFIETLDSVLCEDLSAC
jgi:4-aminobutyrate aminotransferase-like enzyme/Ser/Thr protein kinase RdoA (MazF antagonist)